MKTEQRIATMTGVSKRLFMALSDFRGNPPQLEDALFQLSAVIDSTSKGHFPDEKHSRQRFIKYIESITTEMFSIVTSGKLTLVDCKFQITSEDPQTFGEIMYKIRNASYHDPNELDALVHWGNNTHIGHKNGKFTIDQNLLHALFLMLLTDERNKDVIDLDLFDDSHHFTLKQKHYPFRNFVGNRLDLFNVLGIGRTP